VIIDNEPIINNLSFIVEYNVNNNEPITISINGVLSIVDEDIKEVIDNVIYLNDDLTLNYSDDYVIFYSRKFL